MNFSLQMLVRIALLVLITTIITALPWPDIQPYLYVIPMSINLVKFLDPIVDTSAMFGLLTLAVTLELAEFVFHIALKLITFLNTGHWEKPAFVGEGSSGDAGHGGYTGKFTPGL